MRTKLCRNYQNLQNWCWWCQTRSGENDDQEEAKGFLQTIIDCMQANIDFRLKLWCSKTASNFRIIRVVEVWFLWCEFRLSVVLTKTMEWRNKCDHSIVLHTPIAKWYAWFGLITKPACLSVHTISWKWKLYYFITTLLKIIKMLCFYFTAGNCFSKMNVLKTEILELTEMMGNWKIAPWSSRWLRKQNASNWNTATAQQLKHSNPQWVKCKWMGAQKINFNKQMYFFLGMRPNLPKLSVLWNLALNCTYILPKFLPSKSMIFENKKINNICPTPNQYMLHMLQN